MLLNILLIILAASANAKLVQVVSLFRHGARYPISSLYDGNETKYIWGQLSSTGMRQHQTLGEIMRSEYIQKEFLSRTYDKRQIQVYSTGINRTMQSVISQLYGLYPTETGPELLEVSPQYYIPPYNNKTNIDQNKFALPFGYQIIPINLDQKIMMDSCKFQSNQMNKNIEIQLDEYKEMNTTYWPFLKKMVSVFNLTGNVTLGTLSALNGVIDCDLHLMRKMPQNFTEDDQRNLQHIDSWYKQLVLTLNLSKSINKDKFRKILSVFDGRRSNPNQNLKWTFLSGHDTDLSSMYNDLNLSSSRCIQQVYRKGNTSALNCELYAGFASSLIFQLYSEGHIKIRSNGKYMYLCEQKKTECSYEEWRKRVVSNLATDQLAEAICGKKQLSHFQNDEEEQSFHQKYKKTTKRVFIE